jgi:sodium transport system permease protein
MKAALMAVGVVLAKELRESLRDRRVLLNALVLGPLLTPVLFMAMVHLMVDQERSRAEQPLALPVAGMAAAPHLVEALREANIDPSAFEGDPAAAVRSQQVALVLALPADFAERWRAGRPAEVELLFDGSRQELHRSVERVQAALQSFSQRTGALRLLARGLDPQLASPLRVALRDQATAQGRAAMVLAILPYFLVLAALLGGMWLAIDATAGERERQSLEPLLITPVDRAHLLAGKVLATAAFSLTSLCLALLAFAGASRTLPDDFLDLASSMGPAFVAPALVLMFPLVLLISAAQVWVAAFARSFREAQTYLNLAQLLPLIPSVILMALPGRMPGWAHAIPLFGQQLAVLQLLRGEPVLAPALAGGALATLALAALLFRLALATLRSERAILGGG